MIITNDVMKDKLKHYSNKNNKISRDVKNNEITRIIKGLYETEDDIEGYLIASTIYGPSYLSFNYALICHELVDGEIDRYTCATYGKKKKKRYYTPFGYFEYRDVPSEVFYMGVDVISKGKYSFQMACPEKALCDTLYTKSPVGNMEELRDLLINEIGINMDKLVKLDIDAIFELSEAYHSTNVTMLYKYLRRNVNG